MMLLEPVYKGLPQLAVQVSGNIGYITLTIFDIIPLTPEGVYILC